MLKAELGYMLVNTLRARQNGRHFVDDIFQCIFVNANVWIPIKISSQFVPKGPINNIPVLVQIMARRRPSDKPLSESMLVNLPTHICVTRPQWVMASSQDDVMLRGNFPHHRVLHEGNPPATYHKLSVTLTLDILHGVGLNMLMPISWSAGDCRHYDTHVTSS